MTTLDCGKRSADDARCKDERHFETSDYCPDLAGPHETRASGRVRSYSYEVGIKPLIETALGVQYLREDRKTETEFMAVSYWESVEAMSRFAGSDPTRIHYLPRDAEFLIEMPDRVQIPAIRASHGNTGGE